MLNCRDNRGGARTVGVTRDLGKTWELHPTDRKGLREPVCMASLIRIGERLYFSNPNTTRGRYNTTIKVSEDEGMTWPEKWHTLYDARLGNGYSSLAPVGDDKIDGTYEWDGDDAGYGDAFLASQYWWDREAYAIAQGNTPTADEIDSEVLTSAIIFYGGSEISESQSLPIT